MKITTSWLRSKNACADGIKAFEEQKEYDGVKLVLTLLKGEGEYIRWANWLVCRIMDKRQRVQYAIFAAESVIHIYEEKYPTDRRPHQAIEAAKKCLNYDAAAAADDAAADDAADDAAAYDAAAYAADADAADAAADAAAYAVKTKSLKKIILYGLSLLKQRGI